MLYCSISLNLKITKEILKYVFMYYLFEAKENNYAFSIIARHTCTEYMFMESIHSSNSYPVQDNQSVHMPFVAGCDGKRQV